MGPHGWLDLTWQIGPLLLGEGGIDTICTAVCQNRCDSSTACRMCQLESIGLDFLFKTLFLHFFLSISSSTISASTLSGNALLGLPTGLLLLTLNSIHFFTQSSSFFLMTCPYNLSQPLLMTVTIGSTPTRFLNSSLVFHRKHIHLIICIFALSNFYPTSASRCLVSLP